MITTLYAFCPRCQSETSINGSTRTYNTHGPDRSGGITCRMSGATVQSGLKVNAVTFEKRGIQLIEIERREVAL